VTIRNTSRTTDSCLFPSAVKYEVFIMRKERLRREVLKVTDPEIYLFGGPLEAGDDGVLDLVKILHSLGAVHQDVGAVRVGSEAPDLPKSIKSIRQTYSITS
jgi:hypothetical protein